MTKSLLLKILPRLLKPIVAVCIRQGVKMGELVEALKRALVAAADEELKVSGKAVSASRLSVMTGVHRPDVLRLRNSPNDWSIEADFLSRIIWKWQREAKYLAKNGAPRVLSAEGAKSEFAALVKSVSVALNPYTVLFELERSGQIRRTTNGVRVQRRGSYDHSNLETGLVRLARDLEDLVSVAEDNMFTTGRPEHHHTVTEYEAIPAEKAPQIQDWLFNQGRRVHEQMRRHLSRFDLNKTKNGPGDGSVVRVVFGSFSRIVIRSENRPLVSLPPSRQ